MFSQERINVIVDYNDRPSKTINYDIKLDKNNIFKLIIPKDNFKDDAKYISIHPYFAQANVGDKGYFLSSYGGMTKFLPREKPLSLRYWKNIMPIHMTKTPRGTYLALVKGMRFAFEYCVDYNKDKDKYVNSIQFNLDKNPLYEDIVIKFVKFPDSADYPEIAKYYRKIQLEHGGLKTLKEKIKTRPELAYCIGAPEIRIMIGVKPTKRR